MKTRTTVAALLLLAVSGAFADPPGPPHRGAEGIDRIALLLDLDEGQKVAVKQVLDEQRQQRAELWQKAKESDARPTRDEMRTQHEKMRSETLEKLRPILSDVQLTKFEALTERPRGPRPRARDRAE